MARCEPLMLNIKFCKRLNELYNIRPIEIFRKKNRTVIDMLHDFHMKPLKLVIERSINVFNVLNLSR